MNVIFPRSPEIESRAADWFRALPGAYFTNPAGIYFIAAANRRLRLPSAGSSKILRLLCALRDGEFCATMNKRKAEGPDAPGGRL